MPKLEIAFASFTIKSVRELTVKHCSVPQNFIFRNSTINILYWMVWGSNREENVWTSRYERFANVNLTLFVYLSSSSKLKYFFLSFEVNFTHFTTILSEQERAIIAFKKSAWKVSLMNENKIDKINKISIL